MIHQVPIKSLPQDWLWCETWCSDASKETAKTIDLCNNPLTKEPKLASAVRILSEWTGYDEEIKELQKQVEQEGIVTDIPPSRTREAPKDRAPRDRKPKGRAKGTHADAHKEL